MNKIAVTAAVFIITVAVVFAASHEFFSQKEVARLDEKSITKQDLNNYVNTVLGKDYAKLLDSSDGLKQLADYYINRELLLAYAKETITEDDSVYAQHQARSTDPDTIYLSALLKQEVQDKVDISMDEIHGYMTANKTMNPKSAEAATGAEKRKVLFDQLVERVRDGHSITYTR